MKLDLGITRKQKLFIDADEDEVLFGGAAGGGKSYGQLTDALLFALRYPASRQLILRRTYPELEKSLIRESLALYPSSVYTYNSSTHTGRFRNGSVIDFGHCAAERDVYQYQSAEYDIVRFDELTHFTEEQYLYLISRVRGANGYPKQVKSSTNPGGVGHAWVKKRFIDPAEPGVTIPGEGGMRRIFIPSMLSDNPYLYLSDPDYRRRLLALPERERRALLGGDWNVFEGQFFSEWNPQTHICDPFGIPSHWRRFRTVDYGLDRLVCLWIAMDEEGRSYVYREWCESDLTISRAAAGILDRTPRGERIYATLAPPDLWARSQESGRSRALLFCEYGLNFTKTANDRESGWLSVKELLSPGADGLPKLRVFRNCRELIRTLPALQTDRRNPNDVSLYPHELTHAPDALRGYAIYYARPERAAETALTSFSYPDLREDYERAGDEERRYLEKKWGSKKGPR